MKKILYFITFVVLCTTSCNNTDYLVEEVQAQTDQGKGELKISSNPVTISVTQTDGVLNLSFSGGDGLFYHLKVLGPEGFYFSIDIHHNFYSFRADVYGAYSIEVSSGGQVANKLYYYNMPGSGGSLPPDLQYCSHDIIGDLQRLGYFSTTSHEFIIRKSNPNQIELQIWMPVQGDAYITIEEVEFGYRYDRKYTYRGYKGTTFYSTSDSSFTPVILDIPNGCPGTDRDAPMKYYIVRIHGIAYNNHSLDEHLKKCTFYYESASYFTVPWSDFGRGMSVIRSGLRFKLYTDRDFIRSN